MAVTEYNLVGNSVTLMGSELNSLATSSGLTAGAISSATSSNVQSDGKGNGYRRASIELHLAAPSAAPTAGSVAYIWFLPDVANQETGSASQMPARPPDVIVPLIATASATAQTVTIADVDAPIGTFYTLLTQDSGATFAASGNTLTIQYVTSQGV